MKTRSRFALILVLVFIGAPIINPTSALKGRVLAQDKKTEPKLTTTTTADDKYGKGGTVETTSDDKLKVYREVWKDKNGNIRETHSIEYDGRDTAVESWHFSKDGKKVDFSLSKEREIYKYENFKPIWSEQCSLAIRDGKGKELDHLSGATKEEIEKKVQEIEDQFIKDGKIPPKKEPPKETAEQEEKPKQEAPKSDETTIDDVEQPQLPKKEVFGPDSKPKTSTPSTQPEAKPSPNPKLSSPPNPSTTTGAIDPCLVGTWRSESVRLLDSPPSGGDGIALTIKANGMVMLDYSQMTPVKLADVPDESNTWSGSATYYITTDKGTAIFKSAVKSEITHTYTDSHGVSRSNRNDARGAPYAALGVDPFDKTYQCERDTLTYKNLIETFTFKRQDNPSN